MKLIIKYQERYSRAELLLRTLIGGLYIYLPHGFILIFVMLWAAILRFIAFWAVLFTGRYPQNMFKFQVGLMKWNVRLMARQYNVSDGYPAFGVEAGDEYTDLIVPYPDRISRGLLLLRIFFGLFYVIIPHYFILYFRLIFVNILVFLAFWIVLFTGEYPRNFHEWVVGQIRWQLRVSLYMNFMTDTYPVFTGDEMPDEANITDEITKTI